MRSVATQENLSKLLVLCPCHTRLGFICAFFFQEGDGEEGESVGSDIEGQSYQFQNSRLSNFHAFCTLNRKRVWFGKLTEYQSGQKEPKDTDRTTIRISCVGSFPRNVGCHLQT